MKLRNETTGKGKTIRWADDSKYHRVLTKNRQSKILFYNYAKKL